MSKKLHLQLLKLFHLCAYNHLPEGLVRPKALMLI
jgi:hypothetical protein